MTVFGTRVLERGEDSVCWCLGTGCWREERTERGGVLEQGAGEGRGQIVAVFGNRVLERGVERS